MTLPSGTPRRGRPPRRRPCAHPGAGADPRHHGAAAAVRRPRASGSPTSNGWAVAAVEPWPGPRGPAARGAARSRSARSTTRRFLADLVAAAADLLEVEPVGVTGFCMGGMFTLKAAGTGRFHRAVGVLRDAPGAASTGRATAPSSRSTPSRPPSACPAMAIVGTVDQWTPPDDVAAAEAAGVTVVRYEGADHGFVHDDSRPAHRADDAADAWRRGHRLPQRVARATGASRG